MLSLYEFVGSLRRFSNEKKLEKRQFIVRSPSHQLAVVLSQEHERFSWQGELNVYSGQRNLTLKTQKKMQCHCKCGRLKAKVTQRVVRLTPRVELRKLRFNSLLQDDIILFQLNLVLFFHNRAWQRIWPTPRREILKICVVPQTPHFLSMASHFQLSFHPRINAKVENDKQGQ